MLDANGEKTMAALCMFEEENKGNRTSTKSPAISI
jgi:hypothetical protein